jgi:3'-phosphoadenosine 5'-phosphosulfate sulfotransferase (PAPS reductase)/FAD synthetase
MKPIDRAAYYAYAQKPKFRALVERSKELISKHPDYAVSTSWGKDSVAMLHLVATVHPQICVINARYPNPAERFADMDRVRDAALEHPALSGITYQEVETPGEWEMYERAGGFSQAETPEQRAAARWWKDNFIANMDAMLKTLGCTGSFIGMRAEESHARKMNVLTHGEDYRRKDGSASCLPIAKWTGTDVWTYLVAHNLPWLRIYDHASSGRERARSGFVFATGGAGAIRRHGVWEDWKNVYPSEFNAWMIRFPELDR